MLQSYAALGDVRFSVCAGYYTPDANNNCGETCDLHNAQLNSLNVANVMYKNNSPSCPRVVLSLAVVKNGDAWPCVQGSREPLLSRVKRRQSSLQICRAVAATQAATALR